jgi:phospholipid/cholesterol/gamma-HCH transport system substrate-binding protein
MPRTRSLAWSELKIGMVAVAALVLAAMIIVAVGGAAGFSWQRYELRTRFPDVKGLKSGAVVRVAGVEVGKVTEVRFADADVEVVLEVRDDMQQRITTESRASIGSLSLLGEPVIDISPSSQGTPLEDGDMVPAGRAPGQLADVAESATQSLEQVTTLLRDIRSGKGTVGKLFSDDQLYKEITAFVTAAEGVTNTIRNGRGTLGRLVRDPAAYERLNASLQNLQEMTGRINAGEGSLGRLLQDDTLAKSLSSTSANMDQITTGLRKGEGTAGKLLTDQELYNRFNVLAGRVDALAAGLENGNGTAGQLLHDKQLYENMNAAAGELRSLIGDIRKDPKKYLNVRVSIF